MTRSREILKIFGVLLMFGLHLGVCQHFVPFAPALEEFNIEEKHAIPYAIDAVVKALYNHASKDASNAPIAIFLVTHIDMCWFDSLAPFYQKAIPFRVKLEKRPEEEHTEKNRNIAVTLATYNCMVGLLPDSEPIFEKLVTDLLGEDGLRLLANYDVKTPQGIGNVVGKDVVKSAHSNGMNSLGDFNGKYRYRKEPFAPTVEHKPVNSPYEKKLKDPSKWQPNLYMPMGGVHYVAQSFITPQMANVKPLMNLNISDYRVRPYGRTLTRSFGTTNEYKRTTDEVIEEVANLNEGRKVASDIFNDKLALGGFVLLHFAMKNSFSQLQVAAFDLGAHFGIHDAMVAAWREKARYDAVRPFSAVRHLYADETLTGYGGPEVGIVDDVPGSEWTSYLGVADHPEYPSATATICGVVAGYSQLFNQTENAHGLEFPMKKGSSLREPGLTPSDDTVLKYDTWAQFEEDCAMSRLWAGVHFKDACTEGLKLGRRFVKQAYEKIKYHLGEQNDVRRSLELN